MWRSEKLYTGWTFSVASQSSSCILEKYTRSVQDDKDCEQAINLDERPHPSEGPVALCVEDKVLDQWCIVFFFFKQPIDFRCCYFQIRLFCVCTETFRAKIFQMRLLLNHLIRFSFHRYKEEEKKDLLFTQLCQIQFREMFHCVLGVFAQFLFPSSVLAPSEKAFPGLLCWPRSSKMNISL